MTTPPTWITRGKSVRQLIAELQTFEDADLEARLSLDGGRSHRCISLVAKLDGHAVLANCEDEAAEAEEVEESSIARAPGVAIETASESDVPSLVRLLAVLFEQEAEFRPDPDANARGLRAILSAPSSGTILVARRAGDVVGMVVVLVTISTALGGEVALLEDLVVSPDARGAGIGGDLLRSAIAWARERGCLRITLLTDATNDVAQALYETHGFARSSMVPFRLALR